MGLIIHFTLGFITSFLGTLTPSMLNMTAAKISLNRSKAAAVKYAFGVSIIVLGQAYVAILFTRYLRENPAFVQALQKIAILIFTLLSFYFYRRSKIEKERTASTKEKAGNSFVVGILLSSLNMFSIPFYCGVTTALDVAGWFQFSEKNIIIFVIGSAMGTFVLLNIYANFAKFIKDRSRSLAKNLNLILSILTGVLANITFIKVML